MIYRRELPEVVVPGKPLGRHVAHDPRSLEYPAKTADAIASVRHLRNVPIFNQGDMGSCTGNAGAGMMSTDPFKKDLTEDDAIQIYSEATALDDVPGMYPPDDTGSNGLAVMKALQARGWLSSYTHAFGLDQTLKALTLAPGITGITWLTGCDSPNSNGIVEYTGDVRGGHEIEMVGIDLPAQLVWFANSWGESFGLEGYFAMSFDDFATALADDGDTCFGVAPSTPSPIVPPTPVPMPPAPVGELVTLAEAQSWAIAGLAAVRSNLTPQQARNNVTLSLAKHWPKS